QMEAVGNEKATGEGASGKVEDAGEEKNMSEAERWISAIGGGALLVYGLVRRSLGGALVGLAGGGLLYRGLTGHCSIYERLGMNTARTGHEPLKIERAVTVNRPPEELYRFWRNFLNLPRFMSHLVAVEVIDEKH